MNTALLPAFAAELVEWLHTAFPAAPASALQAAGLVGSRAAEGHVCVDLAAAAGGQWQGQALPELTEWRSSLLASGFVAAPGGYAPLTLDGDRLYLGRLWADEVALATELQRRAAPVAAGDAAIAQRVQAALDPLFAGTPADDGQRLAATTALRNRIAVISGGPGTGKTTTVAKVLAALVALQPELRIRLAAPTGKAAARMLQALDGAKQRLGLDLVTLAALPDSATTLHRLLGYRPDSAIPRHGPSNPLALDVLVVDEASMIDLALFTRLLQALPAHARLILLGDRDQLASVEAGSAFAELVRLAGHPTAPLAAGIALLTVSHRFGADSGIGALAKLSNAGDADGCIGLLRESRPDLDWHPGRVRDWQPALLGRLQTALAPYRQAIAEGNAVAAFAAFDRLRLLCALREGPAGIDNLNRLIETRLFHQDARRQPWYAGRPVIIRANDPALGLANGDIGLTLQQPDGLRVVFAAADGLRAYAPARLPKHDTAFALTVHQSQGSEFDEVWLLLPDEDAAVLSRSLIYTAVTRARSKVAVWGSATTLAAAVARDLRRESGLRDRLINPDPVSVACST